MMPECELMTICMICNREDGTVLVQNRKKEYWQGIAFPGGHVEEGEGFGEGIVREVREETGLEVRNLQLCGIVHWEHSVSHERSIIACYKTFDFSGELRRDCDEGHHEWIPAQELHTRELAPWLSQQLAVFEDDNVTEMFYAYDDEETQSPRAF